MNKAIVTGGTGFIGFNVTLKLQELGWNVCVTGRSGEQCPDCRCLGYDFGDLPWGEIGKIDVLFHQAAITDPTVYDEELMLDVNLAKSMRLFQNAAAHGCRQIVYASSCAVYGDVSPPFVEDGPKNPLNIYGKSKLQLDHEAASWAKEAGVNIVGLRYSNVFGPHENHKGKVTCMVTQIGNIMQEDRSPRLFKWGEQSRDFVYVKDVVEYNLAASRFNGQGVFNAGSGHATTFIEVVDAFNCHLGKSIKPEFVDNPYVGKYQNHTLCDMTRAEDVLSVKSRWSLADAISDYYVGKDVAIVEVS